jgi:hypothetical protein
VRGNERFAILDKGVPRTFRNKRETALETAQISKRKFNGDIIEIRSR